MSYSLDTHILLWVVQNHPKLSDKAKKVILDRENELFFSTASIWEVAIKFSRMPQGEFVEPHFIV